MADEKKNTASPMEDDLGGLDDDTEETLKITTQEKDVLEIPKKVGMMSVLITTMVEGDKEEKEIPLPNVKTAIMKKVISYMTYHVDNPPEEIEKPLKSANMADVVSQWDADFVDVSQEMLFELILAANYMDIKPLLDLTCAKVASMIKGKTPEQIRKTFNIQNDFTPEEEAAVRAENKWAEES
mmetsp:Transcript_21973/g.47306  ORF Transcript_21973/g.47306 Transcript_21973/m.47306 type:complete len:183 (-) Transcript_21973:227-775(-)|eukprot:CAMPEP_0183348558 /NCGR_PEP_ID=MMETSP0164_2-20130417/13036_1 /TAXON_ID=221442 /ORGANISM="Coccolithus pelagicus ssp braarudi, Strain PLY182g" /LENGTH=182 /DNA_ID=CAMNT_0025520175 /DNA_START=148 /DNA_END=696 /DNA_ORIENTATION=-